MEARGMTMKKSTYTLRIKYQNQNRKQAKRKRQRKTVTNINQYTREGARKKEKRKKQGGGWVREINEKLGCSTYLPVSSPVNPSSVKSDEPTVSQTLARTNFFTHTSRQTLAATAHPRRVLLPFNISFLLIFFIFHPLPFLHF